MIIELAEDRWSVIDPDDCTRLHVSTRLSDPDDTEGALRDAGIGRLDADGSHALVNLEQLRTQARAAATAPDWDARWEAMVTYAGTKGWVSADGRFVRAHIEVS